MWELESLAFALGVVVMLVVLVVGGATAWILAYRRVKLDAQSARQRLGRVQDRIDEKKAGQNVVLRGRLEYEGNPCQRYEDGAQAVSASVALAAKRFGPAANDLESMPDCRAQRALLVTSQDRVRLVGRLPLLAGPHEWWPGRPLKQIDPTVVDRLGPEAVGLMKKRSNAYPVFRSAPPGTELLVAGVLEANDEKHEASEPIPWQLQPKDGDLLTAVGATTPKFRVAAVRLISRPLAILALLGLAVSYFAIVTLNSDDVERCRKAVECQADGRCSLVFGWGLDRICAVGSDSDCRQSELCKKQGLCSEKQGQCLALANRGCVESLNCKRHGECNAKDDRCVAATDEQCQEATTCRETGRCRARHGQCVAATSGDCRASVACQKHGACSAMGGRCVARASEKDCRNDAVCLSLGKCTFKDGQCVAVADKECRSARICKSQGKCHATDGRCVAQANKDCKQSDICRLAGACTAIGGECVPASNDACRHKEGCWRFGRCTFKDGQCVVGSDDDCRWSGWCAEFTHCKFRDGECVKTGDCRHSPACTVHGCCRKGRDRCVAISNDDCSLAEVCKRYKQCKALSGRCVLSCEESHFCRYFGRCTEKGRDCVVGSHADCERTDACPKAGACSRIDDKRCGRRTDEDCRRSELCDKHGLCSFDNGDCVLGSDEGCQRRLECRDKGACTFKKGICIAASDADCQRSLLCENRGWCRAKDGKCVN